MTDEPTFRQEYESKVPKYLPALFLPRRFVMAHGQKVTYAALALQIVFALGYPALGVHAYLAGVFNEAFAAWANWLYMAFFVILMMTLTSLHHYRMLDLCDEIDKTMGLHNALREALTEVELEALSQRMIAQHDEKAVH